MRDKNCATLIQFSNSVSIMGYFRHLVEDPI